MDLHKRLACLAVGFGLVLVPAFAERPPNFVVILADDLGYGDLGVYGHPSIRTPQIDRMAAEGVRLTEYYSAAPSCTPARAALLTGRYPLRSGLVRVLVPKEKWGIPDSEITLAEALQEQGYATAAIGKWHLGGRKPYRPQKHGFDRFFGVLYSNDMVLLPLVKWPRFELMRNDKAIESPAKVKTLTQRYTDEAVRFIGENKDRPFFLYLAHTMPHVPLRPSDGFKGKSDFGIYGDVVEEIDAGTGRILEALKGAGVDDETLVVFTSDNGPWLGGVRSKSRHSDAKRKRTRGSARPLRGAKGTTWEGGMRVPFVARWPGRIPEGGVRGGIVTAMDLYATMIEAAGGNIPTDRVIDGRNILPMLRGEAPSPHNELFYYFRDQVFAVRSGRWKLHRFKREPGPKGRPKAPVRCEELYDLFDDPGETRNVAADHPDIVKRLRRRAQSFHAGIEPVMKLPSPSSSVFSGLVTQAPNKPGKAPR